MASGASPLVFNNVTLAAFQNPGETQPGKRPISYRHLFDGGPADNLGIETLRDLLDSIVASAYARKAPLPGCMFVLVDADSTSDPDGDHPRWHRRDTRGLLGRIIDTNFVTSIDALFAHRRTGQLEELRPTDGDRFAGLAMWRHRFIVNVDGPAQEVTCFVWHIHVARLKRLADGEPDKRVRDFRTATWRVARGAETQYMLTGRGCSAEAIQQALFDAARVLVREDAETLEALCAARLVDPGRCQPLPAKHDDVRVRASGEGSRCDEGANRRPPS